MRTDADGRFRLSFPPEQVSERRLTIMLRDQAPRLHRAEVAEGPPRRDHPRAGEGRGTVLRDDHAREGRRVHGPGGDARGQAGGGDTLLVRELGAGEQSVPTHFSNDDEGDTDDDGRIPAPDDRDPKRWPSTWGQPGPPGPASRTRRTSTSGARTIRPGIPMPGLPPISAGSCCRVASGSPGRVVDTDGRPIAGQKMRGLIRRGAATGTRPRPRPTAAFTLGPLRPANYVIHGEGQYAGGGLDPDTPPILGPIRVIRPVRVYLKEGVTPAAACAPRTALGPGRGPIRRFRREARYRRPGHIVGDHPERSEPGQPAGCASPRGAGWRRRSMTPSRRIPPTDSAGACRTSPVPTAASSSPCPKGLLAGDAEYVSLR